MMAQLLPVDPANHRALMGTWVTGVSLITTSRDGLPTGCTANSLTSLSLEPPSLMLSLDTRSRTLSALRDSGRFCVNVLASTQAELSRKFADPSLSTQERFASLEYRDVLGAPVIDGCLASLVCQVMDMTLFCDHMVVAGHVIHGAFDADLEPLVFYRGEYLATVPISA